MNSIPAQLEPLPYHRTLCAYLRRHERELWNWFASAQAQADYTEHLRLELLKGTYRLDAENHSDLYRLVDEVTERLELKIPVTVYQAQNTTRLKTAATPTRASSTLPARDISSYSVPFSPCSTRRSSKPCLDTSWRIITSGSTTMENCLSPIDYCRRLPTILAREIRTYRAPGGSSFTQRFTATAVRWS
jgi:hypothetical protein